MLYKKKFYKKVFIKKAVEAPWSVLYHVTIYLYVYRISLVCDIYYAINENYLNCGGVTLPYW